MGSLKVVARFCFLVGITATVFGVYPVAADETVKALSVETLVDDIDGGTGGLAIDEEGNLYTADFGWRLDGHGKGGHQIFKVDPDGKAELFCDSMRGASGNAMDSKGNLFQSSIGGNFISRVTPDGKATVFCREGLRNPVGIAIDRDNNLYVCNCGGGSIQKITSAGESSVFCRDALLQCPNGIALGDDGNFYVANFSNGDVIKIDNKGKASRLTTLPGNNNGHLCYYKGQLFVVARAANQVYRVTLDGEHEVFVGSGKRGKANGDPLESSLSLPNDIGVSPDGQFMYVNETSPTSGDPKILGPTRIRRILLEHSGDEQPVALFRDKAERANLESDETQQITIDDFAWIAGHWQGEAMGGKFEETWNPPFGGTMMGMFKLTDEKGDVNFYELLTIVPVDDSFVLRLKHFSKDLVGWEEKDKAVEFPLVSASDKELKFDGLVFRRVDVDEMTITVVVEQNGERGELVFKCTRNSDK